MSIHCCSSGLVMCEPKVEEILNGMGQHYFKVTAKIGAIFGSEVEGELEAIGPTKEIALERLAQKQKELYESLWA